jgi:AraC-like DNA-binding protein
MFVYENIYLFLFVLPVYQLLFYTVQQLTFSRRQATRFYNGLLLLSMLLLLIINATLHLGGSEWVLGVMHVLFYPLLLGIFPLYYVGFYSRKEIRRSTPLIFRMVLFAPSLVFLLAGVLFFSFPDGFQSAPVLLGGCKLSNPGFAFDARVLIYCILFPVLMVMQATLVFNRLHGALQSEWQHMRHDVRMLAWQKPLWVYVVFGSLFLFVIALMLGNLFLAMRDLLVVLVFNTLLLIVGGLPGWVFMRYRVLILLEDANRVNSAIVQHAGAELPKEVVELEPVPALLTDREVRLLRKNLEKLMSDEMPYLAPGFSLNDLCGKLKVDRRVMTWFLNRVLDKNFYTLINGYRIVEAIKYLEQDSEKYTIDAIAAMVGFRSKSSFYAGFKKHTGTTPHAYLKENSAR